jgi:hypothetical protein
VSWLAVGVIGVTVTALAAVHRDSAMLSSKQIWQLTWLRRATMTTLIAAAVTLVAHAAAGFNGHQQEFVRQSSEPVLAAAAKRGGTLLTVGDLSHIQLRTRRPVVLFGTLDWLIYVLEAAPRADRILQRIYGLRDFREGTNELFWAPVRARWEARSPDEWRDIAREFGVTDILTDAGWKLRLPAIAASTDLTLYTVPSGIVFKKSPQGWRYAHGIWNLDSPGP